MKRIIKHITTIAIIILISSCVEEFDAPTSEYEEILVVDGFITDEKSPITIRLEKSFPINEPYGGSNEVRQAKVKIIDDLGNESGWFEEAGPGIYKSDTTKKFRGTVGRKYKLHIETGNNKIYESDFEPLKTAPPIDKVYWEYKEKESEGQRLKGVQVYLDANDEHNDTWFYRWEFEETWEFNAMYRVPEISSNYRCWKTKPSEKLLIHNTKNLTNDVVKKLPIHYVSNETNRLRTKYSILVKQYALYRETYNYLENVLSTNNASGSLFDPIPSSIKGNIKNINDPEEPVLGFFQASGVSKKRLFINYDELPPGMYIPPEYDCQTLEIETDSASMNDTANYYIKQNYIEIDRYFDYLQHAVIIKLVNSWSCVDCSVTGNPKKPDFWED